MAEELIIRVKVDGYSPQKEAGRGTTGGGGGGTSPILGLLTGMSQNKQQMLASKAEKIMKEAESKYVPPIELTGAKAGAIRLKSSGFGVDRYDVEMLDPDEDYKSVLTDIQVSDYSRLVQRAKQGGIALAWRGASAVSQVAQHKNGDAYANAQMNNAMKLASYGSAIAMSGPAAPFVASAIAINEVVTGFTARANYNYDRTLETQQIQSMKALAGDVSYGRRRGGR